MPLPLIVKAAAIGAAAYAATRWMAEQRRQRSATVSVFPTSATHGSDFDDGLASPSRSSSSSSGSLARENHPGEAAMAPGVSSGPSS